MSVPQADQDVVRTNPYGSSASIVVPSYTRFDGESASADGGELPLPYEEITVTSDSTHQNLYSEHVPVIKAGWDSTMLPSAYVHGGLPVSTKSVRSGTGLNSDGIWERASVARTVRHVPSPTICITTGEPILELPVGVFARRILAFLASCVLECGESEFMLPSQPRVLARMVGLPALSAAGYRRFADVFRMCLSIRTEVYGRNQDGSKGQALHSFTVGADVSDPSMGIRFSLEDGSSKLMKVSLSKAFCSYVLSGNVVSIPANVWGHPLVRSSAVALDVSAVILARLQGTSNAGSAWVSWKHLGSQLGVFSVSWYKVVSVLRASANAVCKALVELGIGGNASVVSNRSRGKFSGILVRRQGKTSGVVSKPFPTVRADGNSAQETHLAGGQATEVYLPMKEARKNNTYRGVNLELLSKLANARTKIHVPVVSDIWENLIDTVMERYELSAVAGRVRQVENWTLYVLSAITREPMLLHGVFAPVKATRNNGTVNKRQATDWKPSSRSSHDARASLEETASLNLKPSEFDLLSQRIDSDGVVTLAEGSPEHYAYMGALESRRVPINDSASWRRGVRVPPVRVKLSSGDFLYPNAGSTGDKGDKYFCAVLQRDDYVADIKSTVNRLLALRGGSSSDKVSPVATQESSKSDIRVAPWDEAGFTVPGESIVDGFSASYTADPVTDVVSSLPPAASEAEAEARAGILKSLFSRRK